MSNDNENDKLKKFMETTAMLFVLFIMAFLFFKILFF